MSNIITKLFKRGKNNSCLYSPPAEKNDYFTLLNHINRNVSCTTTAEVTRYLTEIYEKKEIDLHTKERLLCFFYFFKNHWQEAYQRAYPLATTEPYDQDMVGLVTSILNESGRFKDAYEFLHQYCIEDEITNKESFFLTKGQIAWNSGKTEEAIEALKRVLTINSKNPSALNLLRGIYSERGENENESSMHEKLVSILLRDGCHYYLLSFFG